MRGRAGRPVEPLRLNSPAQFNHLRSGLRTPMTKTIGLFAVLAGLVGCGGTESPAEAPARDTALVSKCGALALGLYENQADFDAIEQRVIAAFAPAYGSDESALCAALNGLTIMVVEGDTEIEPGVFGAYNHATRIMRLPNRRLAQTVIGHESAHV